MGGKTHDKKSSKKSSKVDPARKAAGGSHDAAQNDSSFPLQRPWITHGQNVSSRLQQQHWSWTTPYDEYAMSGYMRQSLTDEPYQAIHSVRSWPANDTASGSRAGHSEAGATSGSR